MMIRPGGPFPPAWHPWAAFVCLHMCFWHSSIDGSPVGVDVTIPPLLLEGATKGEVLFVVTHDPTSKPRSLTLPCKADGLPLPTYSWLKNGRPLEINPPRLTMSSGSGSITFHKPQSNDTGSYQCIAENSAGKVYSDISILGKSITISFPKGEPRVVTVNLGDPLQLPCENPGGYPNPSLHWVIQRSDGSLHSISSPTATVDDNGSLWFSKVTVDDASDNFLYACAASSSTRTEYRMGNWVYLNVSLPEGYNKYSTNDVYFVKRKPFYQHVTSGNFTVLKGSLKRLFCLYGGHPTVAIQWWKDDKTNLSSKLVEFGKVLEIENAQEKDQGTYFCRAYNSEGGGKVHKFHINIEAAPEFILEPGVVNQPQGENASFQCSATGEPPPTISWAINGETITTPLDNILSFYKLKPSDKGVISCNASNIHGYVYSTGFLNVLSMSPEIIGIPQDTKAFLGSTVSLKCEAYGAPDPIVIWSKLQDESESTFISESKQYKIGKKSLNITSLTESTAGTYHCNVENKYGEASAQATVTLMRYSKVTLQVSQEQANVSDSVNFMCWVESDPDLEVNIIWMKNDVHLDMTDMRYAIEEANSTIVPIPNNADSSINFINTTSSLTISNIKGTDSGVYSCIAKTEVDETEDSQILTVLDVPENPELDSIKCADREVFIHWKFGGGEHNVPLTGFSIEMQTDLSQGNWKVASELVPASERKLSIRLRPGRKYVFRVSAHNAIGASKPSKASETCITPSVPPDRSPSKVEANVIDTNTVFVKWEKMDPYEHNGPGFRYEVQWAVKQQQSKNYFFNGNNFEEVIFQQNNHSQWEEIIIEDWEQTEVQLEGLLAHTLYKIRVVAANEIGRGPLDNEIEQYSGTGVPVKSPTNVRVRRIMTSSAIVAWIPLPQEDIFGLLKGYEIIVSTVTKGVLEEVDSIFVGGRSSSANLTNLSPYTTYEVRVRVKNTLYKGPSSVPVLFRTLESKSSKVTNLRAAPLSSKSLLVEWDPPQNPNGEILNYLIQYVKLDEETAAETPQTDSIWLDGTKLMEEMTVGAHELAVKLPYLEKEAEYFIIVFPRNHFGLGERETTKARTEEFPEAPPIPPSFQWKFDSQEITTENPPPLSDVNIDGNTDEFDSEHKYTILSDTDKNGIIDENDVLDINKDGKLNKKDFQLADINKDGVVDFNDIKDGDRNRDNDFNLYDVGDANKDGKIDFEDIFAADRDDDGDLDFKDEDGFNVILQDLDNDGNIDEDDLIDIDGDGKINQEDVNVLDFNNNGQLDIGDLKKRDRDKDGDIDGADIPDFNQDGFVDSEDILIKDIDGNGIVDFKDFHLKGTYLGDTNNDGEINAKDVVDINEDGYIDEFDVKIADINKDKDINEEDINAGDKNKDNIVDSSDIRDLNNDGISNYEDALLFMSKKKPSIKLLEDANGDGNLDEKDVDGDGVVSYSDISLLDVNNDGSLSMKDILLLDKNNDRDVDLQDLDDYNGDGNINHQDLNLFDKDGDGDIDEKDILHQKSILVDTNNDGKIGTEDLLDITGDGDVNKKDFHKADIDKDGDIDSDDVNRMDIDGDGDVDINDMTDVNNDGKVNHKDFHIKDKDVDGDIDAKDYFNRNIFLADTDMDRDVDENDVLDVNEDGKLDANDIKLVDINLDGKIDESDIEAGDFDGDEDIDIADVGDINEDGTVDYKDLLLADRDGDHDIDSEDRNGYSILLSDFNKDGRIDEDDIRDVDGDNDIDPLDITMLDINKDGVADFNDVLKANSDNDGDIDAADIFDVDEDGDVDGNDLLALDKDVDGDIDDLDRENFHTILKDINEDGNINQNDVLDNDGDGNITDEDIKIADINGDGKISRKDIVVGDMDKDNDVDFLDIRIKNLLSHQKSKLDSNEEAETELVLNWAPKTEKHSGSGFYIEYRPEGSKVWIKSNMEEESLNKKIRGLDPELAYEVRMVAKDGRFETPSEVHRIGPLKHLGTTNEEPTLGAVMENGPASPLNWTWFIVAILGATTMLLAVFFSIWAYTHRLKNVKALRKKLYQGVRTSTPDEALANRYDPEDVDAAEDEPSLTAEKQRQQMSALLRRQETAQSVDSFASHDDDFAEYGDETMGRFDDAGSLVKPPIDS